MATEVTPPLPAPPSPSEPPPSVTQKANKELAAVKTGNDPLRPVRYTWKFVSGTIGQGLNDMAYYGRKGSLVGLGLGIIVGIATGGIGPVIACAVGGLLLGAAGGAAKGAITGGMNAVGREYRGQKYAEDLVQRKKVQSHAKINKADYRDAYRQQQLKNSYTTQQVLERTQENTRDYGTYWQDRENNRQSQNGGLGF